MKLVQKIISLSLILIMISPVGAFAEDNETRWNSMWTCGTCHLLHYDNYTDIVPANGESGVLNYSQWIRDELNSDCYYDYYFKGNISITNCMNFFLDSKYLTYVDFGTLDTSSVTTMNSMFRNCYKLVTINALGLDTSNVKDMTAMFFRCDALESLDLSTWDMSNCTKAGGMFSQAYTLDRIRTPLNVKIDVELPMTFYDSAGNAYENLPKNLDRSILLLKDKDGDFGDEEPGPGEPGETPDDSGFVLERDANSYAHWEDIEKYPKSGFYKCNNYLLAPEFYRDLRDRVSKEDQLKIYKEMYEPESEWGGSCYGIASTMALVYNKVVNIEDISGDNTGTYYSAKGPCDDNIIRNNIAYCHLAQSYDGAGSEYEARIAFYVKPDLFQPSILSTLKTVVVDNYHADYFLKILVDEARQAEESNKVLMLCYNNHCILVTGYDYDKNKDLHLVSLYDENSGGKDDAPKTEDRVQARKTTLTIKGDYSEGVFYSPTSNAKYILSDDSISGAYSLTGYNAIDYMSLVDPSKIGFYKKSNAKKNSIRRAAVANENDVAKLEFPEGGSFTIKNSENEELILNPISDRVDKAAIEGNMEVLDYRHVLKGNRSYIELSVNPSESFTVEEIGNIATIEEQYSSEEDFIGPNSIKVSGANKDAAMDIGIRNNGKYMTLTTTKIESATFNSDGSIIVKPYEEQQSSEQPTFSFEAYIPAETEDLAGIVVSATADEETIISASKGILSVESGSDNLEVLESVCLSNGEMETLTTTTDDKGIVINANSAINKMNGNANDDAIEHVHVFGAWETTKAATEIASGEMKRICSECGFTETQVIAQLAPTLPTVKLAKPKAAKKSATVKWKKVSKSNQKKIQGIEIQVATDPDFADIVKTATASKKKTSKKIKGLSSKKTYYIRIRAYKDAADGKHVSAWKAKKVKIK